MPSDHTAAQRLQTKATKPTAPDTSAPAGHTGLSPSQRHHLLLSFSFSLFTKAIPGTRYLLLSQYAPQDSGVNSKPMRPSQRVVKTLRFGSLRKGPPLAIRW